MTEKDQIRFNKRGRLIEVAGVKWRYKVTAGSVIAYSEKGQRELEDSWKIKGFNSPSVFERGQRKRTSDGVITPKEIANWLNRK